ncbi:DUF2520 domain-containing protein [uncultured Muribaculum sp.]|uniref:Rossmann-like and DUF2520 domain-containing protein n=1 Tax=uncultured Muribaculum sp. TaxID=1918613 RepID=UPI0025D6E84A|nr:DUF2520 domain-containing protein [uncultured Muribaculum sp.]
MEGTLRPDAACAPGRIVMLGSGNVATHLAKALGPRLVQVWSRNYDNARSLAEATGAEAIENLDDIATDADLYILSVSDDAIAPLASRLKGRHGVWAHTSGSIAADALDGVGDAHGVFYPLQTFSRNVDVDMSQVPLFVEATTPEATIMLENTAAIFTNHIYRADSERRRKLHIAAVFACNFANYMWLKADSLLAEEGLDIRVFAPLIEATLTKAMTTGPEAGQTGPARRGDRSVIASHEAMLGDDDREIYSMLSSSILKHFHQ